ncbi:hypothetical protein KJ359_010550 [Pestalotiopsis sp. 9143b]|nr:hypothetical protein KJ359_010550 [Pestalotiopsis sp. 9143b]
MKLQGVQETTLIPLIAKALDAASPQPVLNDKYSKQTLSRIDASYDWKRATGHALMQRVLVTRTRLLDLWAAEFLEKHDEATVLHVASGLDSRCLRLAPIWTSAGKRIRWIDLDLPDVVEMRRSLELPEPEGDYELRPADVLSQDWLESIPNDRPTLIIAEGLVMYLKPEDGLSVFKRLAKNFQGVGGQILCDLAGYWMVAKQEGNPTLQMAEMYWAVDDPEAIVDAVRQDGRRGFRLAKEQRTEAMSENYSPDIPFRARFFLWLISWLPWRLGTNVKFNF